jgi:selenocysteine lyase/cysteine desulfurase
LREPATPISSTSRGPPGDAGLRRGSTLNNAGRRSCRHRWSTPSSGISGSTEIGGYEAAKARARRARVQAAATLLNCERDEIAIGKRHARRDMALLLRFQPGDCILTARAEYAKLHRRSPGGPARCAVVVIPSGESGEVSVDALRGMLDARVKLIAITHVPTNGGLVNPAAAVGRVAREAGVPYLLDACQSVGQMPVDVAEIGCDMLSATGRRSEGAARDGLLYVRRDSSSAGTALP